MHSRLVSFLETGFLPRGRICLGTQRFTMLEGKHSWTVASCHYNGPEMFQLHISNPRNTAARKPECHYFRGILISSWDMKADAPSYKPLLPAELLGVRVWLVSLARKYKELLSAHVHAKICHSVFLHFSPHCFQHILRN